MKPAARLTSSLLARKGYAIPTGERSANARAAGPYDLDAYDSPPPKADFGAGDESRFSRHPASGAANSRAGSGGEPEKAIASMMTKLGGKAQPGLGGSKKTLTRPRPCDNLPTREPGEATGDHSIVAMTLRLEERQHRRLRLLSVHCHKSAREIMTAALDIYLDGLEADLNISDCECLKQSRQENPGIPITEAGINPKSTAN